jgi:hypothetical protein
VVSREELSQRVRDVTARDTDPARVAADEATLKLLALIPPGLDYGKLVEDLLAEQVLGFYDPETRQLFVGGEAGQVDLDSSTKWVIVHEMTHALTDQVFNYGPATIALDKADKSEESAAYSALLEGDAVLLQTLWADKYLNALEQLAAALGGGDGGTDVLSRAPQYIRQSLYFPYDDGLAFVQRLYDAGGYAAVDAAYRKPPTSTEQIMHPEAYQAGQGSEPPALPNLASATGCTSVRGGTVGQFDMQAVLEEHLTAADSAKAVEGWNGDAYGLVSCGNSLGVADRWQTDPGTDPSRLVDALNRWAGGWSGGGRAPGADGRFTGPKGSGRIVRSGSHVDVVLARDADTMERLVRALG